MGQQHLAVDDRHRVVVDIDDPGIRGDGMGDLVDIAHGRQPGPDVEELADSGGGQEPHGTAQERAVLQRRPGAIGDPGIGPLHGLAVDGVVVLVAEGVVVHAGDVRGHRVDARRKRLVLAHYVSSSRLTASPRGS
jgi:hypothetical protein